MTATSQTSVSHLVQQFAANAGLSISASGAATDFTGEPTIGLELKSRNGTMYSLEVSEDLGTEIDKRAELMEGLRSYLQDLAKRMQTPRPDVFLTLHGLPLSFQQFSWPYHRSTSGADSLILHGIAQLAELQSPLHARIAASMTVTLADVLPALEQPFAEDVTFNAIRKTLDLGQLELLKSGNRQPVPVSTRYYSYRQKRFIFSETNEVVRKEFVRTKVFWIGLRLGGGASAWIGDPYDAQYLDCSPDDLRKCAQELSNEGWLVVDSSGEYAAATDKLASCQDEFITRMESALQLLKPRFNEEMRAGHTNM